jgi:hypothetical protein
MKLQMFNSWKDLVAFSGRTLQYQTTKASAGNAFVTHIRDEKSKNVVVRAYGTTPDSSRENAVRMMKSAGSDALWNAIQTGETILQSPQKQPEEQKHIDWRDGSNHRYRAQKRIVGEGKEDMDKEPKIRNYVAKHARSVNKAGAMRDKKNDYRRNPKHKKKIVEGA